MAGRTRAFIGLGANVGNPRANLTNAVRAIAALPGVRLRGVSSLYVTRPVGVVDQPDFLNAVVGLDVPAGGDPESGAMALLMALKGIEQAIGRKKSERWGPREVDLDLLLFGSNVFRADRPDGRWLEVPHPQAHDRLFVLAPLAELAPRLRLPRWGESVAAARKRQQRVEGPEAVRRISGWDPERFSWVDESAPTSSGGPS